MWTYHILSADGLEESTITKRRKLKVNCTQSLKRVEFTNGKETKYEEKAVNTEEYSNSEPTSFLKVIDNLASLGQNAAMLASGRRSRPSIELNGIQCDGQQGGDIDEEDPKEISNMLLQTQDNFLMLLREKKDALVKMFPELVKTENTRNANF